MEQIFRETKGRITFFESKNPDFPAHVHDDMELVYVKIGCGTAWCDGKKHDLSSGMWFLVFPNQVHHYTDFCDGEYLVLILKPSELLRYDAVFLKGIPVSSACKPEDDGLSYLLETAYKEYVRDGYSDIITAYLTALLGKLLSHYPIEKSGFSRNNVLRILEYCTDHYKEDLSLQEVAAALSISRSCVSHIFSSRLAMNFCDYVNSLRLKEAEKLLQNRNFSVTEIANLSGFPTLRTFNRAFLKKHGISPTVYRKGPGRQ